MKIKSILLIFALTIITYAKVSLNITTSQSAMVIDIMDNVTEFDRHCPEFKNYWRKRFKISNSDKKSFSKYREVRSNYRVYPKNMGDIRTNQSGVFVNGLSNSIDPILNAFFASSTTEQALTKLSERVSEDDRQFLKQFFDQYSTQLTTLISEFMQYSPKLVKEFRDELEAIDSLGEYLTDIQKFYAVTEDIEFRVIVNWWPKVFGGKAGGASAEGGALIVRINNSRTSLESEELISITVHEAVHAIEMQMSESRKRELSDTFIESVNLQDTLYSNIGPRMIFEPLAVTIGQMIFIKKFYPSEFKLDDNWYANRWINCFSQPLLSLIEPHFTSGEPINSEFMKELADLYVSFRRENFSK